MRILSMTASFGKLQGRLELQPGLNILQAPNESGKSTWCAFLLAMFYGLDTRERRSKQNLLPEKTRYQPWNGAPMEGTMELLWQGRRITLERTSSARVPMGILKVYDTQTGQTIPGITAENCGQVLLGVERSVLERTAFLRQSGMAVTAEPALEQRLNALISTGDDTNTAWALEKKLKELHNALKGRSGRIQRVESEIQEIDKTLFCAGELQTRLRQEREEQRRLEADLADAEALVRRHEAAERWQRSQQAAAAQQEVDAARQAVEEARRALSALPDQQQTELWQQRLDELLQGPDSAEPPVEPEPLPARLEVFRGMSGPEAAAMARRDAAALTLADSPAAEEAPAVFRGLSGGEARRMAQQDYLELSALYRPERDFPAVFHGKSGEEAIALAERDEALCRRLMGRKAPSAVPLAVAILLTAAGAGIMGLWLPLGIGAAGVFGAGAIWLALRRHRQTLLLRTELEQARSILNGYGAQTPQELPQLARRYGDALAAAREKREQLLLRYGVQAPEDIPLLAARYAAEEELARQSRAQMEDTRSRILQKYRARQARELPLLAAEYEAYLTGQAEAAAQAEASAARRRQSRAALEALVQEAGAYAPCQGAADVQALIARRRAAVQALRHGEQTLNLAQAHRDSFGSMEAVPFAQAPTPDREECAARAEELRQKLADSTARGAQLQGRLEARCDPEALQARRAELEQTLAELQERVQVVETASRHLQQAKAQLQARFAPRISQLAGSIFNRLTEGRYEKLLLREDFSAQTAQRGSPVLRASEALSCGTADQLYLAVRLAMAQLLLGQQVPLVLDEALAHFDDRRAATALDILSQLARERQILLFTCHGRERQLLQTLSQGPEQEIPPGSPL